MAPGTSIPAGARLNALREMEALDRAARAVRRSVQPGQQSAAQAFAVTSDSNNWTSIGPRPTDPGLSPTSGRVNTIAVDPRNNNVVYIGGAMGGVWKTTDGGTNWTPLTDGQPSLAMGAIALDPSNPDIVYAGTGEANYAGDSYYGAGILKSTDAGATWTSVVGPFNRDFIAALGVHPQGQVILAAATSGVWRSSDAGATWSRVQTGVATAVYFDRGSGDSAWAAIGNPFGDATRNGIYHSTDGGQTWGRAPGTGGGVFPTTNVGRIELAGAPTDPNTIYAQVAQRIGTTSTSNGLLGIWKSTDGGATWSRLPVTTSLWGTQMWYDNTLRVSPQDPNIVWSGGLGIQRSLDGGQTWTFPSATVNGTTIHVDYHALAFTADGSKLYIGNDGGAYSTTDVTGARPAWRPLNATLGLTQFYPGMSLDATNAAVTLGGTQDNGTQRMAIDGTWSNITCGDGGYTAIDPAFPGWSYAACQGIAVQRNAGGAVSAFIPAQYGLSQDDDSQFIAPLIMDPSNPQMLYFGTTRAWQSRDSGGKWTAISGNFNGDTNTLTAIAVAPSDPNVVYAGSSNGKLQVTTNALSAGGATWIDQSTGLPGRVLTAIAVDPIDSATVYVTYSGFATTGNLRSYIYKSADGGANWTNISGNLPVIPVNDLVIDPDLPGTVYVATDIGVKMTTDGGATWSTLGNGLPNVAVHSLKLQRGARVLRAGTHGRSIWEIAVPISNRSLGPAIDSLSPARADSGGAGFTLTATGSGFVAGTVLRWNGQSRATRLVDATHITANIPASDVAAPGRVAVSAFNASSGGGSSVAKAFVVGQAPVSAANAFVNAANPTGGSQLAQRSIASIYGTNLASGVSVADKGAPLPFTLADTTLVMGGNPVPLFFVSPGQINFQVPRVFATLSGTTNTQLVITQGSQNTTVTVQLRPFSPALFTTNAQGTGQASTVIAGTGTIASPVNAFPGSRPAKPGEFISIYCTGLGDVSNQPSLGSASPSSPLAATLTTPAVTIGGLPATVQFSGLAPGFVGLYQVNVRVPDGVAPGGAVAVVLTIGGVASNTATIAVDAP